MRWLSAGCALAAVAALAMACGDSGEPADEPGVSGFVFNDRDGDGVRDQADPGVEGWTLLMCMGDMCQSAKTGGGGRFHFNDVPPGRYHMGLMDVPAGWQEVRKDCSSDMLSLGQGEHNTVDMAVRFVGEHVSGFGGSVWNDGAPVPEGTRVEALVGERVCGETNTCGLRESRYFTWVISAVKEEGCGQESAEVRFRVGGTVANQTAQWHEQGSATVNLFAGPELAVFGGIVLMYRPGTPNIMVPEGATVSAYVGERLCGESTIFVAHPGPSMYQIVVLPDSLRAGCAKEGAPITFSVGGEAAAEQAVWQPGVQRLQLSVGEPPSPSPAPSP